MLEIIFIAVLIVIGVISSEWDHWFGGLVIAVSCLTAAQWWFQIAVWATILANPGLALGALVAYIATGLVYATAIRFPRWITGRQSNIESEWKDYIRSNPGHSSEEDFHANYRFRPFTAAYNADRIAAWAMLWPWGVLWDCTHRPVRFVYEHIARLFSGLLVRQETNAIKRATQKKGL